MRPQFTLLNPETNEGITQEYRGDGWRIILGWDIHNDCEPFIQLWYEINSREMECAGTYRYEAETDQAKVLAYTLIVVPYATRLLNDIHNLDVDRAIEIAQDTYKLR